MTKRRRRRRRMAGIFWVLRMVVVGVGAFRLLPHPVGDGRRGVVAAGI
jgi:hypothetical protein